jgi:rhodanese-related sulfurtransferase
VSLSALQQELEPRRVAELLERGEIELVDVREPYEHRAGRIAAARHVELGRLAAEADSIGAERPVVFYCRLGARSGLAAQAFRASGREAYNLQGGALAWTRGGLPFEGEVADH